MAKQIRHVTAFFYGGDAATDERRHRRVLGGTQLQQVRAKHAIWWAERTLLHHVTEITR